MHIDTKGVIKNLLALLGIDLGTPLHALAQFVSLIGSKPLATEMKKHITDTRRAELATDFRGIADALDKSDFDTAALDLLTALEGIA